MSIFLTRRLRERKLRTYPLNYGRDVVANWGRRIERDESAVLDVGCGVGSDLLGVRAAIAPRTTRLYGIDVYGPSIEKARAAGIDVRVIDVERDRFPFEDESLDYVIANQILEHTKEIFWIVAEAERCTTARRTALCGGPEPRVV